MLADLRFAFRLLAKAPGFAFVAIVTLGLGIATATTMFTFYNAVLVRPIPFIADEDTVVRVRAYNDHRGDGEMNFSQPDFLDVRQETKTLDGMLLVQNRTYILGTGERPDRVLGAWITAGAFTTLGVRPILGRDFRPEEDKPDSAPVAILGYSVWKKNFGGRDDVIGEKAILNGEPVTIIGVMPEGFRFEELNDLWMPFRYDPVEQKRGSHGWPVYARLKPGVTLGQAQVELATIAARLAQTYPITNDGVGFRAVPLREHSAKEAKLAFQILLGAVIFVLLIACANVANLLLSRGASRGRELAVRAALGAGRFRLVRQLLTESLLLGAAGGLLGIVFSFWGIDLVLGLIPVELPFWLKFELDWRVLAFTSAASLGSALLFGLLPALHHSRPDLAAGLKDGARGSTSAESHRVRSALVVFQLAMSLALLVGAGLMMRSFIHLLHGNPGMDPENVLTFRTGLPPTQFKDKVATRRFFATLRRNLAALPGVEAAGFVTYTPSSNSSDTRNFYVEGRPVPKSSNVADMAIHRSATVGALEAMRIPLLRGRLFTEVDNAEAPRVMLIDQAFADRFFPRGDALGQRVTFDDPQKPIETWHTIVGIVGVARQDPANREPERVYWTALPQEEENFMTAVVRVAGGDPLSFKGAAQDAVIATQPGIPIYWVKSLRQIVDEAVWHERFFGELFAAAAAVALFLAAIGIYGVMAYNVAQRTQEIGVRIALGAPPDSVVSMMLHAGVRLIAAGLALGFVFAWFAALALESQLYGVSPHDPPTFALVPLLLAAVGLLACYVPSRRATLISPLAALRAE